MSLTEPSKIQAVFDQMGIGTEEQRAKFRALAEPIPMFDSKPTIVRFGTDTLCDGARSGGAQGENNGQLERAARGNQI